ncbi:MAG: hypothetical protein QM820_18850 [Minicystis sp.]
MSARALPILAGLLLALAAGCDNPDEPKPSYTGSLRVVYKSRTPGGDAPRIPSQDTTFNFKTSGNTSELTFGGCRATFELPKAKGDRFHWVVKSGGPCATDRGPATIRSGEFTVFPKGGLTITLDGVTPDDLFDVEWSTVIGSQN